MRFRDTLICFLGVVVGLGLLTYASSHQDEIFDARVEMKLAANANLENLAPGRRSYCCSWCVSRDLR